MRHFGTWVVLGACWILSGCAAGVIGPLEVASEEDLRLLPETVTSVDRLVLTAGADAQVEESVGWQGDDVTDSSRSPLADEPDNDESPPADEPAYEAEPLAAEPGNQDAPLAVEPPPGEEPILGGAVASDQTDDNVQAKPLTVAPAEPYEYGQIKPDVVRDAEVTTQDAETIPTPGPLSGSQFRPGEEVSDQDRISRLVTDVPVDIRPTAGEMPMDLAAAKFGQEPTIDESWPSDEPADVFCSYSPWTICYRPLYFEDIKLERYGCNVGCLQTGLSGVRFFGTIAALPYKMTVRPPRSCQCSNGFSRCGDCPLPGYGARKLRIDASLVEAAAVAGVVYILP